MAMCLTGRQSSVKHGDGATQKGRDRSPTQSRSAALEPALGSPAAGASTAVGLGPREREREVGA